MGNILVLPMREYPDILNLLNLFNKPGYESERREFNMMLDYFSALSNQYNALTTQMNAINERVSGITDKKNPVTVMAEHITNIVTSFGAKLKALADGIVEFAKNTYEAAVDKSKSAVGAVSGALHIHEGLEAISKGLDRAAERAGNLENFHKDRVEVSLLAEFEIPSDLASLSVDELKTVYAKLLDMGMNADLSSCENAIVKDLVEEIEGMLPKPAEHDTEHVLEAETEQGEEM